MTIEMKVLDQVGALEDGPGVADSVLLTFRRPGHVEVVVQDGRLLLHVYEGAEVDMEQPPLMAYEPGDCDLCTGDVLVR